MNREKLLQMIRKLGWKLERHGGNHDIYSHPKKTFTLKIPRHRVINSNTARSILKDAQS